MPNLNSPRVVYHDKYEGSGYSHEKHLINANLIRPDQLDPVLTFLMGKESDKFPLSFVTETSKGGYVPVNTTLFTYNTMGRLSKADVIGKSLYADGAKLGEGGQSTFSLPWRSNWFKDQHNIVNGTGRVLRQEGKLYQKDGLWFGNYRLITGDPNEYVTAAEVAAGTTWSMSMGANVGAANSRGNESNVVMPGKMQQQLSFLRKSYEILGNYANKVVEIQLPSGNGKGYTSLFCEHERWQHTMQWKLAIEEAAWFSPYNRTPEGIILTRDPETGEPIPYMAGLDEQIPNKDTFGELTAKRIKEAVRFAVYGATDADKVIIDVYAGVGGREDFDAAFKEEMTGYTQIAGDKFVTGSGSNLMFGGYFASFKHVDGHVVNLKKMPLNDLGDRALAAPKHPISGLPITSHDLYFVDRSIYDGKPNLVMCYERGREMVQGIVRGMAPTPYDFKGNKEMMPIATDRDASSIHFMTSKAVVVRRNTHCFKLQCDLNLI